jgi:serine/threonine protein phosphatase PrpC
MSVMSRARSPLAAAATDPGRERANNEDRVLCEPDLGIFAVIDGVGGESAGEVAAETALEVLRARLSRRTTDSARLVREAIALANRQIYERAQSDARLSGMSCVLTVAVLDGGKVTVGQVGDSRLYALAPGDIRKVTPDHSPVGAREDAGDLSELEAMHHPRRNEIFRDVGSSPHEPDDARWIDVLEVPFEAGGALLLCSDGLSDMLPSREILETVESNAASPRAAVRALIERANAAGGKDNVSAVLVLGDRFAEAVRRRDGSGARGGRAGWAGTLRGGADRGGAGGAGGAGGTAGDVGRGRGGATAAGAAAVSRRSPASSARQSPAAPGAAASTSSRSGAAWARTSAGDRLRQSLAGRIGKWLLVLALLFLAGFTAYRYRGPLASWAGDLLGRLAGRGGAGGRRAGSAFSGGGADGAGGGGGSALAVGIGDGGFATIAEALAQARPGDTVDVAPGRYPERIVLRSGVSLVSRIPRGAVLQPPPAAGNGGGGPAVLANGVRGARLAGFRVAGTPQTPWNVGLRLDGSEVVIEETEVTGAAGAAIEIRGADRSTLRYCYVHHNAGPGIVVAGDAAPRLLANLITGNGARPGAPAPGVEVRDLAAPLLAGNRIEGNGGPGVSLPVPERVDEVWRWNIFGAVPREQAVRVASGPAGAAAGAPARAIAARSLAARPAAAAGAGPPAAAAGGAAARAPRRQR